MKRIKSFVFFFRKKLLGKWNYFLWHQKVQLIPLQEKYYNQPDTQTQSQKCVIFMANGIVSHGGLADRIKGILSVYSWCLSRSVVFKIHFVSPFSLNKYLLPNEYDWMIDEKDVFYNSSTKVSYLMHDLVSHSMDKAYLDKKTIQWMDEQWLTHNGQIHVYTNTDCCLGSYSELFSSLFRTSDGLSSLLSLSKSEIGKEYITISFRFTTLLGDFHDCINHELPIEEKKKLIEKCLCSIKHIRSKHPSKYKIVVFSDSEKFLSNVKELSQIHIVPGKVGHIDNDNNTATHAKTFLDFFLISNAAKVYLVKSNRMYNSDFPRIAALISKKPFELVEI